MQPTRRSILRSAAAVGAVHAISTVARPFAFASTKPNVLGSSNTIRPSSTVVILEGPWVISPGDSATVSAIPLGAPHNCDYGVWSGSSIVDPADASKPASLASGASCIAFLPSGRKSPSFQSVFDTAFAASPFVYLKHESLAVTPNHEDRKVLLPIPDRVFLGGQLKDATIADKSGTLQAPSQARSYVATIFEYFNDQPDTAKMTVSASDGNTFDIESQHLIFRMKFPSDSSDDRMHIEHAFSSLAGRSKGDQNAIDISINAKSTKMVGGANTGGISEAEMGIEPGLRSGAGSRMSEGAMSFIGGFAVDYPSCMGGGIIIGVSTIGIPTK